MLKCYLILLCLLTLQSSAKFVIPSDLNVIITSLKGCDASETYPLEVSNVVVNLSGGNIIVTGTLTTSIDLVSPVEAVLKVEKDEFGAWIEIPCVNGIGSCTYNDLCIHSIPPNGSCPDSFINNNIPCRCPIPKGSYTIPSSLKFEIRPHDYFSIYNGKYWTRALVTHKNVSLTCYEVYFTIEDKNVYKIKEDEFYSGYNDINVDRPFVTLV